VANGTVVVRAIRVPPINRFVVVGVVTAIVVGIRACVRMIEGAAAAADATVRVPCVVAAGARATALGRALQICDRARSMRGIHVTLLPDPARTNTQPWLSTY
jgi:hypothetical protein